MAIARFDFKLPENFLLKASKLADKTDKIIPVVLEAGAEVVYDKVKSSLESVIGENTKYESRSTGELLSALGVSPAKQDRDGNFNIKVGFSENRPDGKSNAMIANIIEYGKSGQPPHPFLKPAKSESKNAAIDAMTRKLESEIEKI